MHPVLFQFDTPGFLRSFLPDTITIYTYGFLIACGAIAGTIYTARQAKKQYGLSYEDAQQFILWVILAAVVGGKVFIIFEDPKFYLSNPSALLKNFGNGFVFYGSLLFAIPTMLIYFKVKKLPALGMLDIMAVTTVIVHAFGRMGCFMAGCCYGVPSQVFFAVTFHDPHSQAHPLGIPLHPTQLYAETNLLIILVVLLFVKQRKQFDGQLFMIYLMLYAVGRSIIEIFRGDLDRGYVVDHLISNSQFISLLVFIGAAWVYGRLRKKQKRIDDYKKGKGVKG